MGNKIFLAVQVASVADLQTPQVATDLPSKTATNHSQTVDLPPTAGQRIPGVDRLILVVDLVVGFPQDSHPWDSLQEDPQFQEITLLEDLLVPLRLPELLFLPHLPSLVVATMLYTQTEEDFRVSSPPLPEAGISMGSTHPNLQLIRTSTLLER